MSTRGKAPRDKTPARAGRLAIMANTTTTTTSKAATLKVTNAAMMRVACSLMENVPADVLQSITDKVLGEGYAAPEVASKARVHLASLEKSATKAEGPSKAAQENSAYAAKLVTWWAAEGGEPATPKELATSEGVLTALGMGACSPQKMNAILAQGAKDGVAERFFDGVGTWLYRPIAE